MQVTNGGKWWEVAEKLGIRDDLCGADHALKLLYIRYARFSLPPPLSARSSARLAG